MRYQVIVGNVGTVYDGDSFKEMLESYSAYKSLSLSQYGRCSGESVIAMDDGEIKWEFDPESAKATKGFVKPLNWATNKRFPNEAFASTPFFDYNVKIVNGITYAFVDGRHLYTSNFADLELGKEACFKHLSKGIRALTF